MRVRAIDMWVRVQSRAIDMWVRVRLRAIVQVRAGEASVKVSKR